MRVASSIKSGLKSTPMTRSMELNTPASAMRFSSVPVPHPTSTNTIGLEEVSRMEVTSLPTASSVAAGRPSKKVESLECMALSYFSGDMLRHTSWRWSELGSDRQTGDDTVDIFNYGNLWWFSRIVI